MGAGLHKLGGGAARAVRWEAREIRIQELAGSDLCQVRRTQPVCRLTTDFQQSSTAYCLSEGNCLLGGPGRGGAYARLEQEYPKGEIRDKPPAHGGKGGLQWSGFAILNAV